MELEADEPWPDLRPLDYQTQELAAHPVTRSRQLHGQGSGADLGLERLQRGFENQLFELVRGQAQTGGPPPPSVEAPDSCRSDSAARLGRRGWGAAGGPFHRRSSPPARPWNRTV